MIIAGKRDFSSRSPAQSSIFSHDFCHNSIFQQKKKECGNQVPTFFSNYGYDIKSVKPTKQRKGTMNNQTTYQKFQTNIPHNVIFVCILESRVAYCVGSGIGIPW